MLCQELTPHAPFVPDSASVTPAYRNWQHNIDVVMITQWEYDQCSRTGRW